MTNPLNQVFVLPIFLFSAVVMAAVTPSAYGQATNSEKAFRESVQEELRAVQDELKNVLNKLDRIERSIQNSAQATEFSPVEIKITTPDGQPIPGAKVRLFSNAAGQRDISVTNTSGVDGIGLSRLLPYGKYSLRVDTADGWYAYFGNDLNVELGKGLEMTVRAPVPDRWASVAFRSDFSDATLDGLVFGERRDYLSGSSYMTSGSPEPGTELDDLRSFPTLENGITKVAARIGVSLRQDITQPNGETETWTWKPSEEHDVPTMLFTPNEILRVESSDFATFRPDDDADFFSISSRDKVAYAVRQTRPLVGGEAVFKVPAGTVEVRLVELNGRASDEVVEEINRLAFGNTKLRPGSVWLKAGLQPDSKWYERTFDLSGWTADAGYRESDATLKLTVSAGDDESIALKGREG